VSGVPVEYDADQKMVRYDEPKHVRDCQSSFSYDFRNLDKEGREIAARRASALRFGDVVQSIASSGVHLSRWADLFWAARGARLRAAEPPIFNAKG
jgi:hypothetical protein